jgi:SNF family Na+-dependent transporter
LASVISSMIVGVYYNMIIAWTLFYFVESFLGQKWQNCDQDYNSMS